MLKRLIQHPVVLAGLYYVFLVGAYLTVVSLASFTYDLQKPMFSNVATLVWLLLPPGIAAATLGIFYALVVRTAPSLKRRLLAAFISLAGPLSLILIMLVKEGFQLDDIQKGITFGLIGLGCFIFLSIWLLPGLFARLFLAILPDKNRQI